MVCGLFLFVLNPIKTLTNNTCKEIPQYVPGAAYRQLEFLLGRIKSLQDTGPFTTQS